MRSGVSGARKAKVAISVVISIAIMMVIFMMSCQNGEDSGSLSESVSRIIAPFIIAGFDLMSQSQQQEWIEILSWPVRKTAHATEYACLGISLLVSCWEIYALKSELQGGAHPAIKKLPKVSILAFALTVIYACSDEVHQLLIDGRAGQVFDVCVDASGALLGVLAYSLIMYAYMRRRASIST